MEQNVYFYSVLSTGPELVEGKKKHSQNGAYSFLIFPISHLVPFFYKVTQNILFPSYPAPSSLFWWLLKHLFPILSCT